MSGIAGIGRTGATAEVEKMLDQITHRGPAGREIVETPGATLGLVYSLADTTAVDELKERGVARDGKGRSRLAEVRIEGERLVLTRDALGVAPLYMGYAEDGTLSFASEVKALGACITGAQELPPGSFFDGQRLQPYFELAAQDPLQKPPERIAQELHRRLSEAVEASIGGGEVGSWLSGGLDSSALAALARPHVDRLHTFAAGLEGAPDLAFAADVAAFIGSDHHEVRVTFEDMLAVLPDVIYHLESFDALLVRSSLTNYLVARAAAGYVPAVFSGEGGDELFAGYEYLKDLDPASLPTELIDIMGRLHNTALQRVDRCASAHGTVAHVAFLDPEVVSLALQIPAEFKLQDGVEKWILRRAMDGALPESVLDRTKAKFWEGAGVVDLMAQYAEEKISDADFSAERVLPNGWTLNSKEELLYYRIFREHFGDMRDLSWMGRTKGSPIDE